MAEACWGCSGNAKDDTLSLSGQDSGASLTLAVGAHVYVKLQIIGPGNYAEPTLSSPAIRFDGVEYPTAQTPAGPTQLFHFHAVAAGSSLITIAHTGETSSGAVPPFTLTLEAD